MLRSAAPVPVIIKRNCCVALFSRCTEALDALKKLVTRGFSGDKIAGIGTISPWIVSYLSQRDQPAEFPRSMVLTLQNNESVVVIGFPVHSVSRERDTSNALDKTHIFSLVFTEMDIPTDNQHDYASALDHRQLLVVVRGSSPEVEKAAELLATGEEIEVAVYQGVCA